MKELENPPRQHPASQNTEKKSGWEKQMGSISQSTDGSQLWGKWHRVMREAEDGGREGWWHFKDGGGWGSREGMVTAQAAPSHTCRAWQRFWPGCRVTVVTVTSQRGRVGPVSRSSHTLLASAGRPTTSRRIRQRSSISWEKTRERERKKIEQSQAGTKKKETFLFHQKKKKKKVRVKPGRYNQPVSICYLPWVKLTRVLSAHWSWSLSNTNNMKTLCFLESRVLKVLLASAQLLENTDRKHRRKCNLNLWVFVQRHDNKRKEADCAGGI